MLLFADNIPRAHWPFFLPQDEDPHVVAGPLLDSAGCGDGPTQIAPCSVGLGGNSSLLSLANEASNPEVFALFDPNPPAQPLAVGTRLLVTAADAPSYHIVNPDPAFSSFGLNQVQYNMSWTAHLVLWTSITGIPDGAALTGTPPWVGPPNVDRTYVVLLQQPWNVTATFNIDANLNGALTTPPPGIQLVQGVATVNVPVKPLSSTGAVLGQPTMQTRTGDNLKQ